VVDKSAKDANMQHRRCEHGALKMEKLFMVAGVSTLNGVVTARFANDMSRAKVLEKNGHTEVRLVVLPEAMDKDHAMIYLLSHPDFHDVPTRSSALRSVVSTALKAPKVLKPTKEPVAKLATTVAAPKAVKVNKAAEAHKAMMAKYDEDPHAAQRREMMRVTFAKIKQREFEEAEAERERKREEQMLEVDRFMGDFNEAADVPPFMRKR
jgi:hypothetical protein